MQKYSRDLSWALALAFCSTYFSTKVPSLIFKKCCHVSIHVILGTHELETPYESGKSQLPCSQRLRLHGLTSSDLGRRTRDPYQLASIHRPCIYIYIYIYTYLVVCKSCFILFNKKGIVQFRAPLQSKSPVLWPFTVHTYCSRPYVSLLS
jgi:hypothetical protein